MPPYAERKTMKYLLALSLVTTSLLLPAAAAFAQSASASIPVSVRILRQADVIQVGDGTSRQPRFALLAAAHPTDEMLFDALAARDALPRPSEGLFLRGDRTFSVSLGCEGGVCAAPMGHEDVQVRMDRVDPVDPVGERGRPPLQHVKLVPNRATGDEAEDQVAVTVHFE
jgi:hypothetical protein